MEYKSNISLLILHCTSTDTELLTSIGLGLPGRGAAVVLLPVHSEGQWSGPPNCRGGCGGSRARGGRALEYCVEKVFNDPA